MGLIQNWLARHRQNSEQRAIDARNAERRHLCVEYANNSDPNRRGEIIARLAELSGEANLKATAERIGYELEGIDRRFPQADAARRALHPEASPSHFTSDLKHFRKEYCGGVSVKPAYVAGCQYSAKSGPVKYDAGPSGEVKA